jgi:beta-trans-bergamotene synthase
MGRKTIPLLLSQSLARWSLAALIVTWTIGLITLWQPPVVVSIVFASLGLRCLAGYLWSYDEKDDYISYCWYGVSVAHSDPNLWTLTLCLDSSGLSAVTYSLSSLD